MFQRLRVGLVVVTVALAAFPRAVRGQGVSVEPLEGRIIAILGDHINIDIGDSGIKGGDVAVILRDGVQIGVASVIWVDIGHTSLRVIAKSEKVEPQVGDLVVFEEVPGLPSPTPSMPTRIPVEPFAEQPPSASTGAAPGQPAPPPLTSTGAAPGQVAPPPLAPTLPPPIPIKKRALSTSANLFHGRLRGWQLYQRITPLDNWYSVSRLDSDGTIDRMYGQPLSLVWSGNVSYRDGSTFSASEDYKKPRPHVYRLAMERKLEGGFVRGGRFFPSELPGLGYVDGAQIEHAAGPVAKFGGIVGLRPDRTNMGFADREPIASAYGNVEGGRPRQLYYSGTVGVLRSYFNGVPDELALLYDQRADLGPRINTYGSAQVDFNTGSAVQNTGTTLSRADLTVNGTVTQSFTVRAGGNHFEPVDIAAERSLAAGNTFYLTNSYSRYWVGAGQALPGDIQIDGDLSWTKTDGQKTQPGLWRLGFSRRGLPGLPGAFLNLSAYNLFNPMGPDYGGSALAAVPFLEGKLMADANVGYRYGPTVVNSHRRLRVSDVNLHGAWTINMNWSCDLGLSRAFADQIQSTTVNGGLSYRW